MGQGETSICAKATSKCAIGQRKASEQVKSSPLETRCPRVDQDGRPVSGRCFTLRCPKRQTMIHLSFWLRMAFHASLCFMWRACACAKNMRAFVQSHVHPRLLRMILLLIHVYLVVGRGILELGSDRSGFCDLSIDWT